MPDKKPTTPHELSPTIGPVVAAYINRRVAELFDKERIDRLIIETIEAYAVQSARNACHSIWRMDDLVRDRLKSDARFQEHLSKSVDEALTKRFFSGERMDREIRGIADHVVRDFPAYRFREKLAEQVAATVQEELNKGVIALSTTLVSRLDESLERDLATLRRQNP